jgi:hypothetical protein
MYGLEMLEDWISNSEENQEKKRYLKIAYNSGFISKAEYVKRIKALYKGL